MKFLILSVNEYVDWVYKSINYDAIFSANDVT